MPAVATLLVTLIVSSGGVGLRHATVYCPGIYTYSTDDGVGVDGPMEMDSRGHAIMETPPWTYECRACARGYWCLDLTVAVDADHRRFEFQLTPTVPD